MHLQSNNNVQLYYTWWKCDTKQNYIRQFVIIIIYYYYYFFSLHVLLLHTLLLECSEWAPVFESQWKEKRLLNMKMMKRTKASKEQAPASKKTVINIFSFSFCLSPSPTPSSARPLWLQTHTFLFLFRLPPPSLGSARPPLYLHAFNIKKRSHIADLCDKHFANICTYKYCTVKREKKDVLFIA